MQRIGHAHGHAHGHGRRAGWMQRIGHAHGHAHGHGRRTGWMQRIGHGHGHAHGHGRRTGWMQRIGHAHGHGKRAGWMPNFRVSRAACQESFALILRPEGSTYCSPTRKGGVRPKKNSEPCKGDLWPQFVTFTNSLAHSLIFVSTSRAAAKSSAMMRSSVIVGTTLRMAS